jgi:hypothetical protein
LGATVRAAPDRIQASVGEDIEQNALRQAPVLQFFEALEKFSAYFWSILQLLAHHRGYNSVFT